MRACFHCEPAQSRRFLRSFHRTETLIRSEIILYACEIKETANGSRRCACGEARQEVEVVAEGRIAPDGEVDERKRATKNGKDEAQGEAHTQKQEKVGSPFAVYRGLSDVRRRMQVKGNSPRLSLGKGRSMKCPGKTLLRPRRIGTAIVHFACITSITCLRGSALILLAPVNG
jgi:hypothetical protein